MELKLIVPGSVGRVERVGTALVELGLEGQRKVTTHILKNMHEEIRNHAQASRAAHKCVEISREFRRKEIQQKMNVSEINFPHLLSRVPN